MRDSQEVWLDQMADQPELSAGPQREVQLIYGQDVEEELGAAPVIQLDFVPVEEDEGHQEKDLWQEASDLVG